MRALLRIFFILGTIFMALVILFVVVHRDRRPRIYFAAEEGDTNFIGQYLASGSNVNAQILVYRYGGNRCAPLLDITLENGRVGAVDFLLKKGANPNQHDVQGGATPLMWVIGRTGNEVSRETRLRMFKMLLRAGADPNLPSSSGFWTPLIYAAELGQSEMVSALLAAGANLHATNSNGLTALHYAGNAEIASSLIAAGADRTARVGGETPAESAVRLGHFSALAVITNLPARTNN